MKKTKSKKNLETLNVPALLTENEYVIRNVPMVSVSQIDCAKAFTEWERRYREEPERFQSEATKLLRETPETYGDACAPYFFAIVAEIQEKTWRVEPQIKKL